MAIGILAAVWVATTPLAVEIDFSTMPATGSGEYPERYTLRTLVETSKGEATGVYQRSHGAVTRPIDGYKSLVENLDEFGWDYAESPPKKMTVTIWGKDGHPVVKVYRESIGPEPTVRWVFRPRPANLKK